MEEKPIPRPRLTDRGPSDRGPSDRGPSDRVAARARSLTPEEQEAGVDDPSALAKAVLADSDARTLDREGTLKEHRHSEDTVEPLDQGTVESEPAVQ